MRGSLSPVDDLADFPWTDEHDPGYEVVPYDPETDEAPEGGPHDCTGADG